jgi:hypothetical protein
MSIVAMFLVAALFGFLIWHCHADSNARDVSKHHNSCRVRAANYLASSGDRSSYGIADGEDTMIIFYSVELDLLFTLELDTMRFSGSSVVFAKYRWTAPFYDIAILTWKKARAAQPDMISVRREEWKSSCEYVRLAKDTLIKELEEPGRTAFWHLIRALELMQAAERGVK